jgi:hypothetical protein
LAGASAPARACASNSILRALGSSPSPMSSMRLAIAYTADKARRLGAGSNRMPHEKLRASTRVIRSHSS